MDHSQKVTLHASGQKKMKTNRARQRLHCYKTIKNTDHPFTFGTNWEIFKNAVFLTKACDILGEKKMKTIRPRSNFNFKKQQQPHTHKKKSSKAVPSDPVLFPACLNPAPDMEEKLGGEERSPAGASGERNAAEPSGLWGEKPPLSVSNSSANTSPSQFYVTA